VSAYELDPFAVATVDKVALFSQWSRDLLAHDEVDHVDVSLEQALECKFYADSRGTTTTQQRIRLQPQVTGTRVDPGGGFETMRTIAPPVGRGWEYLTTGYDWGAELAQMPSNLVEKAKASSVEPGRYDLVIDPSNLWLTIHESIGHSTELDRAIGEEANYAGTSFVAPPEKTIGRLRFGPEFMNIQADRTQEGSLARVAWDDEGVPADQWLVVEKGTFKDYQTTREQVARIARLTGVTRSHGCSFAESWNRVQFQRMPNISLLPGERDLTLDDIVAATDRGIVVNNRGSWSIDHQRYNFQFSGQAFYEVRGGKIVGMLRDVAYQSNTPVFWNAMDMIGGTSSYWMGGSFSDGKGEPSQLSSVSHGCVPARFRNVTILNTRRTT